MSVATRPGSTTVRALATAIGALALVVAGVAAAHDGGGHGGGGGGGGGGGHAAGAAHSGGGHGGAVGRGGAYGARGGAYGARGGYAHYARGGQGGAGYRSRSGYVPQAPGAHYARGGGGVGTWRGGGGGWHGGGGGWWHGRWWGGYGLGLYFATLPWYYETYWWGGVPYYYADDSFYRWNDAVAQYEVVAPPAEDPEGAAPATAAGGGEPFVYPRQGQNEEQQRRDRYDCYRWAADQTGFDPTHGGGAPDAQGAQGGPDQVGAYRRAESACLEGRGYTVR